MVGIVAAADHFCETHTMPAEALEESGESGPSVETGTDDRFLALCLPQFDADERSAITEMLETEYVQLLRALEFGHASGPITSERTAKAKLPDH